MSTMWWTLVSLLHDDVAGVETHDVGCSSVEMPSRIPRLIPK